MSNEPRRIQEHNMREFSAVVEAIPEDRKAEARNYIEGYMDSQLLLMSQNRFAFGMYSMEDAEDYAAMNTINAACLRFGLSREPITGV